MSLYKGHPAYEDAKNGSAFPASTGDLVGDWQAAQAGRQYRADNADKSKIFEDGKGGSGSVAGWIFLIVIVVAGLAGISNNSATDSSNNGVRAGQANASSRASVNRSDVYAGASLRVFPCQFNGLHPENSHRLNDDEWVLVKSRNENKITVSAFKRPFDGNAALGIVDISCLKRPT